MATISVIIPIHNVEDYLTDCLKSVEKLAGIVEAEIILIDDGSTDNSKEIAEKFVENNEKFVLYEQEACGVSVARNLGVEKSTGQYLLFIDSDDIIVPEVYKEMLHIAEKNDADVVRCNFLRLKYGSLIQSPFGNKTNIGLSTAITNLSSSPNLVYDTPSWNKVIRRDLFIENEIRYPEGVVLNEDAPVMLKVFYFSKKCITYYKTGYLWRIRTDAKGLSATQSIDRNAAFYGKIDTMKECVEFCREKGIDRNVYKKLIWKQYVFDLMPFIGQMSYLDEEEYNKRLEYIKEYIDYCNGTKEVEDLPAGVLQIINNIGKNELEDIERLINFTNKAVRTSPIIYDSDTIRIELPENIFDNRYSEAKNEYIEHQPTIELTEARKDNNKLILYGYVFFEGVQTNDEYKQSIKGFLICSRENAVMDLPTDEETTGYLAVDKMDSICTWNFETNKYDYSGCGFSIVIDPDKIAKDDRLNGDITLHLKYKNALCEGSSLLRRASADAKKVIKKWSFESGGYRITCLVDKGGALFLRKERLNKKKRNKNISIPVGKKYAITINRR